MILAACLFFFFNDTATTEIYTLSLHDALPISAHLCQLLHQVRLRVQAARGVDDHDVAAVTCGALDRVVRNRGGVDRKSTRLNSSHSQISYAVFCLKKKKKSQPYNT